MAHRVYHQRVIQCFMYDADIERLKHFTMTLTLACVSLPV